MMFKEPISMSRALESQVVKVMLPTHLRSNMLATLPIEIRRRSMFIAGEQSADVLQRVNDAIVDVLRGNQTEEGARARLQALPDLLDNPRLQSEGRARLILETNIDMARGYGGYQQSQDVDVLSEFPAWELYRAEERKEPRDWPARWAEAGGVFFPDILANSANWTIKRKNDMIVFLNDKEYGKDRISWLLANAYLQSLEWNDNEMRVQLSDQISELQGQRHNGLRGVEEQLLGVLTRHGRKALGNDYRAARWIERILSGKLSLGYNQGAGHESFHESLDNAQRENTTTRGMGQGNRDKFSSYSCASWAIELVDKESPYYSGGSLATLANSDYSAGRMIALKDDPIWTEISAFGLPYAPFDYNSGMDLRDIDRDEAEALGLLDSGDVVQPERLGFNLGVEAHPSATGSILDALVDYYVGQGIGRLVGEGAVRLIGGGS